MNLKIAHIGDLKGLCFNIPDYQRGYRWETKQIWELLDDLLEFNTLKNGAFYCLQPLVVVKNAAFQDSSKIVFDVIDGQQRLTTMYLILNYLESNQSPYRLRYERTSEKSDFLTYENGEINYPKLKKLSDTEISDNPDYFYLSRAIIDIETWFSKMSNRFTKINHLISNVIINVDYQKPDINFYESLKDDDINQDQRDVRFIWYDATESTIDYQGSISVFKRLNYGKTSLTASELIKALLFQCDVYDHSKKGERKQVAFRMSTEWDRMEKALQNRVVWSMLAPDKKDTLSNISFVLSYVAAQLAVSNNLDIITSPDDDDYDYIVFDKYIKSKREEKCSYEDIVSELWQKIQDVFDIIMSWFNDREVYHLIGLRLTLLKPKNKKRTLKEINDYNYVLKKIFEEFDSYTVIQFKEKQREEIGKLICINNLLKECADGKVKCTLKDLSYGKNDNELIRILLAYNVTLCMNNSQDSQRFPFWFYQNIIPSLEHIHPQHLHDEDIDFELRCQWYSEKCNEIKTMDLSDVKKKEIINAQQLLDEVLCLTDDERKKTDKDSANSFNEKKKKYEANEGEYRKSLIVIDTLFDELAGIDEEELHSICNMALVDKTTNTALGNKLMDGKRQKLIKLQDLFNQTKGEEGAYTFMGTWKVFNKQFLNADYEEKGDIKSSNLQFWSKTDRENYFSDIEKIYNQYVKK